MKHFPIRVGLCGILLFVAGTVSAQQELPPVQFTTPAPSGQVKPGDSPAKTTVWVGEPFPAVRPGMINVGPYPQLAPQPIFCRSGNDLCDICAIEAIVRRTINLGTIGINTKKLADTLERGVPNAADKAKLQQAEVKVATPVQLAAFNLQELAQAGKEPPPPDSKQLTDEINRNLKAQADIIRSMDLGSFNRGVPILSAYPSFTPLGACPGYAGYPWGPYGAGYPGAGFACGGYACGGYPYYGPVVCVNGICYVDGCAMVLTGRTGLELTMMIPPAHDVLKLPRDQGLYIKHVYAKTPAEAAGFKKDDILIEMDGKKVPSTFFEFLNQVFHHVKNNEPIPAAVLRGGQRVEVNGMTITEKRILPPLPHECPLDLVLPNLIQVAPGINSVQPSTVRNRELRTITRPGGITEYIWVDPTEKK